MMFYKNTKAMFHPIDGDTNFFEIVVGVLKGNTFAEFLSIICQNYVLRILWQKIVQEVQDI